MKLSNSCILSIKFKGEKPVKNQNAKKIKGVKLVT